MLVDKERGPQMTKLDIIGRAADTGERNGWKAIEAARAAGVPENELAETIYYAPYCPQSPAYIRNASGNDLYDAYSEGFGTALACANINNEEGE